MARILPLIVLILICPSLWAAGSNLTLGPAAENAGEVLLGVVSLVEAVLYIAATVMFTSAIMKFRIHFQNPQQIPMSTPITELILAIVLGSLPIVTELATRTAVKAPPSVLRPHMNADTERQAR